MKALHRITALLLLFAISPQFARFARACGPEILEPIFVLKNSPDPPFQEFTQGKLGIVKPSFGRKTLVIAYRYLNGGAFTEDEQKELVEALKGAGPQSNSDDALKTWITARQLVVKDEAELPEIYHERGVRGYDFFPNCTANAFEVATETLKDRVARFGADNPAVHEWLSGQDVVFSNCSGGSVMPATVGAESPIWLRKDREYQTAAALFYSLKFDQARVGFEKIAQDGESDWQQTADYLVGRTLIRQASLETDEKTKRTLYEKAETYLFNLLSRTAKYRQATQNFLALTKYRLRPEERVRELAQILAEQSGNENLRQDLIDYVWLLDKFDQQVQEAEAERLKLLNSPPQPPAASPPPADAAQLEWKKNFELLERGELIQFWVPSVSGDGQINYSDSKNFLFKPDASQAEILAGVETAFGRKLSEAETKELWQRHSEALEFRKYRLSPNRKWDWQSNYEGCLYDCKTPMLQLLPPFLMMDELSEWVFTFQSDDETAYSHALAKWRQTHSDAWFVAALTKAKKVSSSLDRLMAQAETVQPDAPTFATVLYHRIRLLSELGKPAQARQALDEIIKTKLDMFPVSAQNELLEQRIELATSITEFLKFAPRKPVMFYEYGMGGRIRDILQVEKEYLAEQGEEEGEQRNERVEKLYEWDDRFVFDQRVVEILNWHFPTTALMNAAHDPALPDYLKERLLFTVWTRGVLLKQDALAQQAATEIVHNGQDPLGLFREYLKAPSATEKQHAATYALVKLPSLSPYVVYGIPEPDTGDNGYYFELAWWCTLDETEYNEESKEVPKHVAHPSFLAADFLAAAHKERATIRAAGNAKKWIGSRVIEWARQSPSDPRVPEALFVAAMANQSYKYGCSGWEHDADLQAEAEDLLLERYSSSPWAEKLRESPQ